VESARRGFRAERAAAKIQAKKSRIAAAFKRGYQEAFFASSGAGDPAGTAASGDFAASGSGDPAGAAASDDADGPDATDDADDVGKESGSGIISAIRSLIFSASASRCSIMAANIAGVILSGCGVRMSSRSGKARTNSWGSISSSNACKYSDGVLGSAPEALECTLALSGLLASDGVFVRVPAIAAGVSVEALASVPASGAGDAVEALASVPASGAGDAVEALASVPASGAGDSVEALASVPASGAGVSVEALASVPASGAGVSVEALASVPASGAGGSVEALASVPASGAEVP